MLYILNVKFRLKLNWRVISFETYLEKIIWCDFETGYKWLVLICTVAPCCTHIISYIYIYRETQSNHRNKTQTTHSYRCKISRDWISKKVLLGFGVLHSLHAIPLGFCPVDGCRRRKPAKHRIHQETPRRSTPVPSPPELHSIDTMLLWASLVVARRVPWNQPSQLGKESKGPNYMGVS